MNKPFFFRDASFSGHLKDWPNPCLLFLIPLEVGCDFQDSAQERPKAVAERTDEK